MTVATLGIQPPRAFRRSEAAVAALSGITLNFVVFGGLLLALSPVLRGDRELRDGFVLLALVPPGVAVIPFTDILEGDRLYSLLATVAAYLGALILTPLAGVLLLGTELTSPLTLLTIMLELVMLPLVASQLLRRVGLDRRLEPYRGPLTNWGFFVVIYTVVGVNRDAVLASPGVVVPLLLVLGATTFGLAWAVDRGARALHVPRARRVSLVLLGTLKNYGLAGGLALALFEPRVALPSVVAGTVMIPYVVWLERVLLRTDLN